MRTAQTLVRGLQKCSNQEAGYNEYCNPVPTIMQIELIRDIRDGHAGARVVHQSSEKVYRFLPKEVADPFGIRGSVSIRSPELQLHSFTVELDDSWLLDGHRNFLQLDGGAAPRLLLDRVIDSPADRHGALIATDRTTSVRYDKSTAGFSVARKNAADVVDVPGTVGVAVSVEPSNWGSFLVRALPKAIMLKNMGLERLFVYGRHKNQQLMLEAAGWAPESLILHEPHRQYRFEKAVWPSEQTVGLGLGLMARCALRSLTPAPSRRDRLLYVTRHAGKSSKNNRYAVNTEQIEQALSDLGFEIVRPETLSPVEQAQLFSEARMVVGPSGAGLFNVVFCAPGTTVIDIESETHWVLGHCNLFASLHLDYSIHWARPVDSPDFLPPHRPFEVDVQSLTRQIQANLDKGR